MFWIHQIRDVLIFLLYIDRNELPILITEIYIPFVSSLSPNVHQQFKGVLESLLVARHNK